MHEDDDFYFRFDGSLTPLTRRWPLSLMAVVYLVMSLIAAFLSQEKAWRRCAGRPRISRVGFFLRRICT